LKRFKFLYCNCEIAKYVFQMILIHFLLIFTESKTFQQTGQTISQSDSDSTKNHFSEETEMLMFLSESRTIPNRAQIIILYKVGTYRSD
jgi:hypothetical protein